MKTRREVPTQSSTPTRIGRETLAFGLAALLCSAGSLHASSELSDYQQEVLYQLARGESLPWEELSDTQLAALQEKAESYRFNLETDNLPYGGTADLWWSDYDRQEIVKYEGIGDSAFWTGNYLASLCFRWQVAGEAEILAQMDEVLDTFDLWTSISGREGYMVRFAGLADDPAYQAYYEGYGNGAYPGVSPWEDWIWLGHSSRDAYDGARFGLANVFATVTDETVREHARAILVRMCDRLVADGWFLDDGQGGVTKPSPWWVLSWMQVALVVDPQRFGALETDYARLFKVITRTVPNVSNKWDPEYYAYNLMFLRIHTLELLEPDAGRHARYQEILTDMFQQSKDHLNPWFALLYVKGTGRSDDLEARAIIQGMLQGFPEPVNFAHAVDNHGDPSIETFGPKYSRYALSIYQRVPTDYQWQRSPCVMAGSGDVPLEYPGLDVVVPYWLARCTDVLR